MAEPSLNLFGGDWTQQKIDIIYNYAKGYLTVFKNQPYTKLLYFDVFAGCGEITADDGQVSIEGAALKILSIDSPRSFDMYYFVELKKKLAEKLKKSIDEKYPNKETYVVAEDCNKKLESLAKFLKSEKGKKYKVLAFIDPKGMQVNWKSLEVLKNLPIDLWILTPTGVGTNRLLKKNGNIRDSWLKKLEDFRECLQKK
jgi:three-Cys-motif partner protein